MITELREEVRAVSKGLMRNKHALDVLVAVAISTEPAVYPAQLAARLGIHDNSVIPVLRHAADGKRIQELPDDPNRRYFARLDSVFWASMTHLLLETIAQYAHEHHLDAREAVLKYWDKVFDVEPQPDLLHELPGDGD